MTDKNFIIIETNKFKTSRISFKFALKINQSEVADLIVLSDLLTTSTNNFNSVVNFNKHLFKLFDTKVASSVNQIGGLIVLDISFSLVASEFLPHNIDEEIISLIKEVILNPNLTNQDYLETSKRKRILEVETLYDDKMSYAINKIQNIVSENKFVDVNSNIEDLSKVCVDSIQKMYDKVIKNSNITVVVNGTNASALAKDIEEKIELNSDFEDYEIVPLYEVDNNEQFICEHQNLSQSKFAVGIKLPLEEKAFKKFQVFNGIYGNYPFSRLFSNIREKQSLAYTVASAYNPSSNMMYIYGGISNGEATQNDTEAFAKVLEALKNELKSIQDGDITDLEFNQSKVMIVNSIRNALDSQSSLVDIYYSYYLRNHSFDIESYCDDINSVTKADVSEMAKLVKIDSIFLLRGDK